jgi:Segregation and condensation protein ScpA
VAPIRASVADAIVVVLGRLPGAAPVSFRSIVAGATERLDVIVRFLAILELYKQGVVEVEQMTNFGDLTVRRLGDGEAALDAVSIADWDDPEAPAANGSDDGHDDPDDDDPDRDELDGDDLVLDTHVVEQVGVERS